MIITRQGDVRERLAPGLAAYREQGLDALAQSLDEHLLSQKVRFPLLEYAARQLIEVVPEQEHLEFAEKIFAIEKTGCYVLIGIFLQYRSRDHYPEALDRAVDFIVRGQEWYICDIIAERVLGVALLERPESTLEYLNQLAKIEDKWAVRSVGVGGHYAVKKGLERHYVEQLFQLLLSLSGTTEFHTKKGIGWAAKTTARFHPSLIEKYRSRFESDPKVRPWFRTKIRIGLNRAYAQRD